MSNFQTSKKFEEELAYDEISQGDEDPIVKKEKLNRSLSIIEQKKGMTSCQTIFNVTNTMLGSALLVMPINYYNSGLLSSMLASIVLAYVSCQTCKLLITHSRDDEIDLPQALKRVLGKKYEILFNVIATIMLYLVGIIHFILMANTLFNILKSIFVSDDWPKTTEIVFDKFSIQWTGIILFVVCIFLFNLKNLKSVLSINDKGVYMIITFCVFLIYIGMSCLLKYEIKFVTTGIPGEENKGLNIVLFTTNLQNLVGVFALAFFNHNLIVGIMKGVENSKNNVRDLYISYVIVWFIYLVLGALGMFAVSGLFSEVYEQSKKEGKVIIPQTIMDLLIKSNPGLSTFQFVLAVIAMIMVFVQLTSVIPIFCFFCRRMFFNLFYPSDHTLEPWKFYLFNAFFNISCLVIQVLSIDPSKVIALTGAIGGFILIYVLPILLHLKCHYWKDKSEKNVEVSNISERGEHEQILLSDELNVINKENNGEQTSEIRHECRDHSDYKKKNIILLYVYYSILFVFGVVALVFQLL